MTEEEPTEPLGPRARTLAEQHVAAFEAWFEEKYGYPLGDRPRTPMHPGQWEDPFAPGAEPEPDPWGPLAAKSREETDRFWDTVGDRRHAPKKDTDD